MSREEIIKNGNVHNNLAFLLSDMLETALMNAESLFSRAGFKLQFADKQNFNAAIRAVKNLKANVNACQYKTQEDFGDSSDKLYQFMLLLVDRVEEDSELLLKLYNHIAEYPSKIGIELDSSVFEY